MEINKQLFEDVLSGKLKGTFVLRNGEKICSSELTSNISYYSKTHPYNLHGIATYTSNGLSSVNNWKSSNDIIDFIPDTNMKENELTITIPDNKVVDWDESKKQNKIVLKDKQLTYKNVCKELFKDNAYFTDIQGNIKLGYTLGVTDPNNATTKHQLECILAKNKLANIAAYLNDGWRPDKGSDIYYINNYHGNLVAYLTKEECSTCLGQSIFKSKELAQQAIEILGEETIKLALEPLGI